MSTEVRKTSDIKVSVGLNEKNVPVKITWEAEDNPSGKGPQEVKAIMLSFFDRETKDTLKIDLWTEDMQVIEMDRFIFQTLRAIADTYHRATQNKELANEMQRFVTYFGEKTEIIPKQ
ncbi:MAG: gliding motility protein GldC [Lewinellaceae bacterium]|nr:gliding motility protein GldC [Phaeodactylibacter sp.]MCB9041473.1 gliding motility protein GldC [Lewinellaceae bacterium]